MPIRKPCRLLLLLSAVLLVGCDKHIGMWNEEDGHAPDSDQDGVLDTNDFCPGTPIRMPVDARGCPIDDDRDGVINRADACPGTPEGVLVDTRGCAVDSDGDGVLDERDQCPGTPQGTEVDGRGCALDSDGDGVYDHRDQCPGTPRGEPVDRWGCADLAPQLPTLGDVHFAVDSAELTPYAYPILDDVAVLLQRHPGVRLRVVGHTDSTASDAYNLDLSQRRAQSVKTYLVQRGGIDPGRLMALGLGEQAPIATNETAEGRARNRRVEFMMDQSLEQLRMRQRSEDGGEPGINPRTGSTARSRQQLEQEDSRSFRRRRTDGSRPTAEMRQRRRVDPGPEGDRDPRGTARSEAEQAEFERLRERDRFLRQLMQQEMQRSEAER